MINLYMINVGKKGIISINDLNEIGSIDAILILGCKVNNDVPSLMLEKRLDKGIEVYNKMNTKLILSGDHGTKDYDEVNVMKDYVVELGIDSTNVFLDHAGFSTYDSIYRAKNIFGVKRLVVVTQEYHMYRALYLGDKLGLDVYGIVSDDIPYKSIMLKNEIREILSRDKSFFLAILKPKSKYLGEFISLNNDGNITNG